MTSVFEKRLTALAESGGAELIGGGQRGIEKESLRITPAGLISRRPHPPALGSALTNRFITTDYSEALLEFVTSPVNSSWAAAQFMCDIHQFTFARLDDEMLWPLSMPCRLRSEADIPIADYGTSNVGRMKTIYRRGLGERYGRYMQAIAGIHFNYSVPDAFWPAWREIVGTAAGAATQSDFYLGLVRNVRRLDWLVLYLFGASPAVCKSFLKGVPAELDELDRGTSYGRYATSLRMSDLGYHNSNQSALVVSANSLDEYIRDLTAAIARRNPEYAAIGLQRDGQHIQLNANQLQIENEYYSTIRPKRVANSGERPTAALQRGGIEYVELRALDLSPFDPVGISQDQQKLLELFLLYCLLETSPPIGADELDAIQHNNLLVARRGREPGLRLRRDGGTVERSEWAVTVLERMQPLAAMLDTAEPGGYGLALQAAVAAARDPQLTYSARLLAEQRSTGLSFADYGLSLAEEYRQYFLGLGDDFNRHLPMLRTEVAESLQRQAEIEANDTLSLDEYLASYYA
ncbi:MAG: glutamate--cysteine ligase [Gammaproteobacteria bacterium]|nr:glutamate--cysteine ligase [Gammaproteobacteria bacterium]